MAARDAGDSAGARVFLGESIAQIERQQATFESSEGRAALFETADDAFDAMIELQLAAGRSDSAFLYLERERAAAKLSSASVASNDRSDARHRSSRSASICRATCCSSSMRSSRTERLRGLYRPLGLILTPFPCRVIPSQNWCSDLQEIDPEVARRRRASQALRPAAAPSCQRLGRSKTDFGRGRSRAVAASVCGAMG